MGRKKGALSDVACSSRYVDVEVGSTIVAGFGRPSGPNGLVASYEKRCMVVHADRRSARWAEEKWRESLAGEMPR